MNFMKYKMWVFDFMYNVCLKHFLLYGDLSEIWSNVSGCLHANYRYSCPILMKHEFSPQSFEKDANVKFHENPSSGRSAFACYQMDGRIDWLTGKTKRLVAFRNFQNAASKFVEGRNLFFFIIYYIHFAAPFCHFSPVFRGGRITCPLPALTTSLVRSYY